jgi:hypothetical protein
MGVKNEEPQGPPEPEPPRREFHFKPTEFEVTNRPVNATPADAPIDVRQLYRQGATPSPPTHAGTKPAPAENDVHDILRANLARAQAKGQNEVIPVRRVSRRKRDYWLLLIGGNLTVVGLVLLLQKNFVTLVFGFSAMILVSIALTWIMWFVMDDY